MSTPSYNISAAEVMEVLYTDSNPNLIYGIKAKTLSSSGRGDSVSTSVSTFKPLNVNIVRIPLVGEVVLTVQAPSSYSAGLRSSTDSYYIDIVSLQSSVHHNSLPTLGATSTTLGSTSGDSSTYADAAAGDINQNDDPAVDKNFTEVETVKPLQPYIGDVIFTGRYGNSIRFSTTPKSGKFATPAKWSKGDPGAPVTIIRNSIQKKDTKKINDYITENFTEDDNIMIMASGQQIEFEQASKQTTAIAAKKIDSYQSENWGKTPQTLLSSGRLIFNSTQREIIMFAKKGIGLSSETNIAMDAKETIVLSGKKIEIGNDAKEPLVLGKQFKTWLQSFVDAIGMQVIVHPVVGPNSPINTAPTWPAVNVLMQQIDLWLSDVAFTKKSK
jgi:hypothetical protein